MIPEENTNDTIVTHELPGGALLTAASLLGCEPENLEASKLSGDASSRCYFRLRKPGAASVVAAIYPEPFDGTESVLTRLSRMEAANPSARLYFANDPCAHVEATELFARGGLPVPRILGVEGSDRTIMLEDMGDIRLQDWLQERSAEEQVQAYRTAIDYIVLIQEISPSLVSGETIYSRLAFDEAKLKFELDFFAENFFGRYLSEALDPSRASAMDAAFTIISRRLAALPRVLTHRDYHARNLMMDDERMVIIDHQDARLGPEAYDLVSLLDDPYTELSADQAAGLTEYFLEQKARSTVPLADPNGFGRPIRLAGVQRMLKAVGTYSYQAAVKYNEVYIRYIEPALNSALKHLKALEEFPELERILESSLVLAAG